MRWLPRFNVSIPLKALLHLLLRRRWRRRRRLLQLLLLLLLLVLHCCCLELCWSCLFPPRSRELKPCNVTQTTRIFRGVNWVLSPPLGLGFSHYKHRRVRVLKISGQEGTRIQISNAHAPPPKFFIICPAVFARQLAVQFIVAFATPTKLARSNFLSRRLGPSPIRWTAMDLLGCTLQPCVGNLTQSTLCFSTARTC